MHYFHKKAKSVYIRLIPYILMTFISHFNPKLHVQVQNARVLRSGQEFYNLRYHTRVYVHVSTIEDIHTYNPLFE